MTKKQRHKARTSKAKSRRTLSRKRKFAARLQSVSIPKLWRRQRDLPQILGYTLWSPGSENGRSRSYMCMDPPDEWPADLLHFMEALGLEKPVFLGAVQRVSGENR